MKRIVRNPEEKVIRTYNAVEPLITKKNFDWIQERYYTKILQKPRGKDYYLFQGFIRCGDCKRDMNVNTRKAGKKRVAVGYYCSTYRSDTTKCSKHYVNEKELAKVVLKTIKYQIKLMANCLDKIFKINKIANPDVNFEILNNKKTEIEDEIENKMKLKLGLYSD